jgi:predicted GIY-YIG superfamily endonuclease
MQYVYLLNSIKFPKEFYIGVTTSIKERLKQHNEGISTHTAKFRPWKLVVFIGFVDDEDAERFEKYLKSGSGREFARRHFRPPTPRLR